MVEEISLLEPFPQKSRVIEALNGNVWTIRLFVTGFIS